MPIFACGACVKDMFVTETEMIDRFVGKQLFSWGYNSSGELGDGVRNSKSSPVQTVSAGTSWKQIENGGRSGTVLGFSAAIKTDGSLWLWGTGTCGALGDSSVVSKSSPVQTVSGGTNWKSVSASQGMSAVKTDGTLWAWGLNNQGNLGNNNIISSSSPVQTVSGGTDWKEVSTGLFATSAIKTDGSLWVWGLNTRGEVGNASILNVSSPVQTITRGTNWINVQTGLLSKTALRTVEL